MKANPTEEEVVEKVLVDSPNRVLFGFFYGWEPEQHRAPSLSRPRGA